MSATGEYVIGIDIGGTNVRVGAVDRQGQLLAVQSAPIEATQGPKIGVEKIIGLITLVQNQVISGRMIAIGVGATGPVDRELGAIQNPYTLPTWENVDILSPLTQRFGVPAALENDADVAALGEAWVGAGRGYKRMVEVTVGTGIGVAYIQDGKVYRGKNGLHPEGGHMVLDLNGPEDYCGARGCWEILASGPAMERYGREICAQQGGLMAQLCGRDLSALNGQLIIKAARSGDPAALAVIAQMGKYHGLGMVNLSLTYLPDCIVLGGGVMREYDLFLPQIHAVMLQHSIMTPAVEIEILPSQLGGQAGVLGAAYAALFVVEENPL
jgi:glucokinase